MYRVAPAFKTLSSLHTFTHSPLKQRKYLIFQFPKLSLLFSRFLFASIFISNDRLHGSNRNYAIKNVQIANRDVQIIPEITCVHVNYETCNGALSYIGRVLFLTISIHTVRVTIRRAQSKSHNMIHNDFDLALRWLTYK